MNKIPQPADWNSDSLAKFLETSHRNVIVAFLKLRPKYDSLAALDRLFCDVTENLSQNPEFLSGFLLFRSHSAFRGASLACLSGTLAECYMLLRGSLESALYGLYVAGDTSRQEIWAQRHEDAASFHRMRGEFTISTVMNHLDSVDSATRGIAKQLYDRTIDFGGHPNQRAVSTQMKIKTSASRLEFAHEYFVCGDVAHEYAMKSAAQVGICCLDMFYHVFRDIYRKVGVDKRLDDIRKKY